MYSKNGTCIEIPINVTNSSHKRMNARNMSPPPPIPILSPSINFLWKTPHKCIGANKSV